MLQAVALGAAVQAGIYEGIVADAGVVDVWQAALGRALAKQRMAAADSLAFRDAEDSSSEDDV